MGAAASSSLDGVVEKFLPEGEEVLKPALKTEQLVLGGVISVSLLWYLSTRVPSDLPPVPGRLIPYNGHRYLLDEVSTMS